MVIYRIASSGPEVFSGLIGMSGSTNLLAEDSQYLAPVGLAVSPSGVIYVGDTGGTGAMRTIDPICPVIENGPGQLRSFAAGQGCQALFRVYEGGTALTGSPPILKLRLGDQASGTEGLQTVPLGGSGYSGTSYSGNAYDLVYDSTLGTALSISKTFVTGSPGSTWVLPDDAAIYSVVSLDRVSMRSDAGSSESSAGVILNGTSASPASTLVVPRLVNGAPIRELEVVYKAWNGTQFVYLKQRLGFKPVNPANVTTRLIVNNLFLENGFSASTSCTSWVLKPFFNGQEIPVATGSSAVFAGTTLSGDAMGTVSFTPATGNLLIESGVAKFKTLDGDKTAGGTAGSWSGVVVTGTGCSITTTVAL